MNDYLIFLTTTFGFGVLGVLILFIRTKKSYLSKAGGLLILQAFIIEQIIYFVVKNGVVHLAWGMPVIVISVFSGVIIFKKDILILTRTSENLEKLARYEINIKIDKEHLLRKNEFGRLAKSMQLMLTNINSLLSQIGTNSKTLLLAGNQMSTVSEEMSKNSNIQATTATDINDSVQEMVLTIEKNTENAQRTEEYAVKSAHGIEETQKASRHTMESMNSISDKILMIQEVSHQTNLLALNASIEAARAGAHGKGFAVVASEIRKLSDHTQQVATEIIDLVNSSVAIAQFTDETLNNIAPDVENTAQLVKEISEFGVTQNQNAKHIRSAVQDFNSVIQQNAASAEEISAKAQELVNQSSTLQQTINQFAV